MRFPETLGELKKSQFSEQRFKNRSVKDEMRENLICKLQKNQTLFPGIVGYDDTVIPEIINAILSKHNTIFLGLRGQAKSRIMRQMIGLLDEWLPIVAGCEINDNPYQPICGACLRLLHEKGDEMRVSFLHRENRFVEKLSTPDVTIADMIGDVDPIKAAKGGLQLSDELTIHYGLVPRANRCVFAINELPDLAGKIQVGLFNILQEGDIQIKGYPIRLKLDIAMLFSANPEDYTARGKIITPLKDRIGSEIHTHYPATLEEGMKITEQEAWLQRGEKTPIIPAFIREIVEEIAFQARKDKRIDKRSGVSQRLPISCLENVISNAERRALMNGGERAVAKITDIFQSLPSITGKMELEYEGELRGAEAVAREIIRMAIGQTFIRYFGPGDELITVTQWFENGGTIRLKATAPVPECLADFHKVPELVEKTSLLGINKSEKGLLVSGCEFILEGLVAQKKISRSEEKGVYSAAKKSQEAIFQNYDKYKKHYN